MATAIRTVKAHLVQTSPDFSAWTTQTGVRCTECSEGAGQIVGNATLVRFIGTVREPGATGSPASQTPLTGVVGQWVRVLIEDAGGAINVGGTNYAALWYGTIDAQRIVDTGGGTGTQSFSCSGIAAHLARCSVLELFCVSVDYTGAVSNAPALRPPVFNDRDGQGYKSATTASIDGTTSNLFDLFGNTPWNSSTAWTAKEALTALIAANGRYRTPGTSTYSGGVTWALSAGTLLDWTLPTLDTNGMTVLDVVNSIISPRRGLTWRLTVSGTTATINVRSIAASSITVGSTMLAAATDTSTPDLSGVWAANVELTEDQSATFDHIRVVGARPLVACSISYNPSGPPAEAGSLQPAWTNAQETTWNTAPDSTTDGVWRTFRLGLKWSGDVAENAGASGLRQSLTITSGDYTGARSFSTSQQAVVSLVEFEAWLPAGEGWTTSAAGPRQECMAFILSNGGSAWQDCQQDKSAVARSLTISDRPATISLGAPSRSAFKGDGDQTKNKNNLATAGKLLVTLGVREPDPLVVSWTRSSASWPRTSPRILSVQQPTAEQWIILAGTVKGISSGSLSKQASLDTVRDDLGQMQATLAFLRAYFSEPARSLSWTDRGLIEYGYGTGAPAPGALVTTATLGTGVTTINAVVTRRAWRLEESNYGTSYTTERIVPDIEALR